jgi:hypothetical protein
MSDRRAEKTVKSQRPQKSDLGRFWRVFEYRRPVPVRRPRFTT